MVAEALGCLFVRQGFPYRPSSSFSLRSSYPRRKWSFFELPRPEVGGGSGTAGEPAENGNKDAQGAAQAEPDLPFVGMCKLPACLLM